jgi:hypothetical protein
MHISLSLITAAGIALAAKPAAPRIQEKKMAQTQFDLGLEDSAYWTNPFVNARDVSKKFDLGTQPLIRVGAPKSIDLGKHADFPLIIYQDGTPKDYFFYDLESSGFAVLMDLSRNDLRFNVAVEAEDGKIPRKPTDNVSYRTTSHKQIDLTQRLEFRPAPGRYLSQIVCRDLISNRVETAVSGSGEPFKDEAVEKFILEERKKQAVPEAWPPRGKAGNPKAPGFAKNPASPELPAGTGIALKADRVGYAGEHASCRIHGSFRLPARFGRALPAQRPPESPEAMRMPVHLIVTGSKTALAFTQRMMIPVEQSAEGDQPVTGYFDFDLLDYANLASKPQTYFLWLFSGDAMTGPVPMALVNPDEVK